MKVKLPDNWSEIRLKQYIEVVEVSQIDMDELDRNVKILSILSNQSEDTLLTLSLGDIKKLISHIAFIYSMPKTVGIPKTVTLNGSVFDINYMINTITGGEYIDLCEMVKDKKNITSNLPSIIALFLKPKESKYYETILGKKVQTLESRNRSASLISEHMSMIDVMTLSGFFLKSLNALMEVTLAYSVKEQTKVAKQLKKEIQKHSKSIGVGS